MNKNFNKGLILTSLGSFWWGFIGVIYFEYVSFIGHIELVVHRCLWTAVMLIITTTILSKWKLFLKIGSNLKNLLGLFLSGLLIFIIIFFSYKSIPWVGLIVALSWAFYNLVRKKINIDTDIGLLIESLFIFPFALVVFYLIFKNNLNDFNFTNPGLSLLLVLAGPMTVIPLFLYVRGVELIGLGPTGMIFYITPTLQFILGYFYYNEDFSLIKFVSFIIIWIAVIIYLKDLYENN